ncbi:hypothetical protein BO94DRAFT_544311 [Aspergillus sclerotioniger CBS 115572]|uniref:Uncharacterized protein n=1 Tax=Aspergillus sclerotioniger CBS 115572 TaxID=1450535 RepID=A0A317X3Z8_9EURO|nr:hypothetical protein BO94DRAFT_544311 [Aspergillus sclerotioniger CBS 115572]PWY93286.1 hypothetical protein BO94DRAFT_544311 [Aspergillus sclerotioniger CBS 115572]
MENRDPRRGIVQRIMEDTQQAMQLSNQAMQLSNQAMQHTQQAMKSSNQAMQHMQQAMHRMLRLILYTEGGPPPSMPGIREMISQAAVPPVATEIAPAGDASFIGTIGKVVQAMDRLASRTARQEPAQISSTIPETQQPQEGYDHGQQSEGVAGQENHPPPRTSTPAPRDPWSQTPTAEWFTPIEDRPKSIAGDMEITTVCTRCFNMWMKRIRTQDDIPDCVFDRAKRKKCEYCSRQRNTCTPINPQLTQRLLRYKQRMEDPERPIDEAGNDWEEFKKQYVRVRTLLAREPIAQEEEFKQRDRARRARRREELKSRRPVEQQSTLSEDVSLSPTPS